MSTRDQEQTANIGNKFLFSIFVTIVIGIVNFAYPLIIGLVYEAAILGSFSVLYSWAVILCIPISDGIAVSVSRFMATGLEKDARVLDAGLKMSTFYLLLVIVILPILGLVVFALSFIDVLFILCLSIVTTFHYIGRKFMEGEERFKSLFKIEMLSFSTFLISSILILVLPKMLQKSISTFSFLIPIILFHLIFCSVFYIPRFKRIKKDALFKFPALITRKMLSYSLLFGLAILLARGTTQSQILISDLYVNEYEVGVLSFWSNAIIAPISLFSATLNALLIPRITNIRQSKKEVALYFVNSANWGLSLVFIPVIGFVILLVRVYPQIIDVISFSKYDAVTYWLIIVLFIFKSINFVLLSPSRSFLSSSEKYVGFIPLISFMYSIFTIVSWIVFVPLYGLFGFAIGIAVGSLSENLTGQIIVIHLSKGKVGYHMFFLLLSFTLLGFGFLLLEVSSILTIILWGVAGLPSITFGIYKLVKILKREDYSIRYATNKKEVEISLSTSIGGDLGKQL